MGGIANPAKEYFKDGIWGWATNKWEKLVSYGGLLFTALHGWDGTAWRKLPLTWGYSDRYAETVKNLDAAAGANFLLGTEVPAGEIWVVQVMAIVNTVSVCSGVFSEVWDGTNEGIVLDNHNPAAGEQDLWTGEVVMKAGDRVRAYFLGCTLNDDIYLRVWGYKMKVAE